MMKKTNQLQITQSDLGKKLIDAAYELQNNQRQVAAVECVRGLVEIIDHRSQMISMCNIIIERAKQRLDAIDRGKFVFTASGKIVFENDDHNKFITHGIE
jgi:hypothetical protein